MNIQAVAAVPQTRSKLPVALALILAACAAAVTPRAAQADGAEAVAAVLVGAALLYAVQDDDHHHRTRVSYHFHDGGHHRCYEDHGHGYGRRDYGRTYYVYKDSHRYDYDRRGGYDQHWDRSVKYRPKGHKHDYKGNQHHANGDRFDRGRDEGRRWNTRVPIH